MAMSVEIHYGVVFGKCDASDWIDYEVELTDEEEFSYNRAVRLRLDLNEVEELQPALQRVYSDIEDEEISLGLENGDEYVMECQGCIMLDPDEVNDKVADRDPHTLEFFGLTGMSDEELDTWDANDVEMPTISEFDPDFEPSSPFDAGWILNVEYINPDEYEELTEEEARAILTELFQMANGDYSDVEDFIDRCEYEYVGGEDDEDDEPLRTLAAAVANELGITDFDK